jgi:hypothetical protein
VIEAVKPADVAPLGTVTLDGTETAELLLDTATATPPLGAAAVRLTVHASLPAPVIEALAQVSPLIVGAAPRPVPLRLTTELLPVEELLAKLSCPLKDPAVTGANCTVTVAV